MRIDNLYGGFAIPRATFGLDNRSSQISPQMIMSTQITEHSVPNEKLMIALLGGVGLKHHDRLACA